MRHSAHRLGISSVKWELEDLSSVIWMRQNSTRFLIWWREKRREREELVEEVVHKIETYAGERHLHGKIYGRPKHIYSIYRKMQDKKKRFDEIPWLDCHPLYPDTPSDVYAMLGYIHELWSQCQVDLRTILPTGRPMATSPSIRLSTALKDRLNSRSEPRRCTRSLEYGVAAHWAYKKASRVKSTVRGICYWDELIKEMMESKTSHCGACRWQFCRKCKRRHPGRRDLRLHSRWNRALKPQ